MKRALALGIVALAGMLALNVPTAQADDKDKKEKLDHQELVFLRDRATDDVNQWKVAEYAAEHAGDQRTRDLGRAVIEERRADLRDIQKIAKDHDEDLKVPDDMSVRQKYRFDQLKRMPGENFDRDYTKDLVANYQQVIPQLKRQRDQAGHVDVREYAGRNVKMFEDHLKQAQDTQREVWKFNDAKNK
jgi:predicted outer membrane protein